VTAPLSVSGWMRYDVVREVLERISPTTILELGVGLGGISSRIREGSTYVGVEPDPESRAIASRRMPGATLLADTTDIDPSRRFDLVCAFEVIEHIEDDRTAAREWVRWLRPGGHLLLSMPAGPDRYGPWDRASGHFRRYSAAGAEKLLVDAGLVPVVSRHYGYPVGYALEWSRNLVAARSERRTRPFDEVTADSARQLQPTARWAPVTRAIGTGIARAHRPFRRSRRGTGLVVVGQRLT
jgi:SAM-dependent methyltransferase